MRTRDGQRHRLRSRQLLPARRVRAVHRRGLHDLPVRTMPDHDAELLRLSAFDRFDLHAVADLSADRLRSLALRRPGTVLAEHSRTPAVSRFDRASHDPIDARLFALLRTRPP